MAMFGAVLDLLTLILLLVSPVVCLLIAFRSGPGRAVPRIGYFAFAVCAVLVALFQWHLAVDGGEFFMVFELFLVPIVLAAVLATAMAIVRFDNPGLWTLTAMTIVLGLCQALTSTGVIGPFMNLVARAYVLGVVVVCALRMADWRRPALASD